MLTRVGSGGFAVRSLLSFLVFLFVGAATVEAIPAFARRYSLPCYFCHDGYPKLSVIGEQFKERGYRLGDDVTDAAEWIRSIPVSFRGTLRQTFVEDGDASTFGFYKILTAGNLGSRVSYWLDDNYFSSEGNGFDRSGIDNAFVRVEILPEELYVRGGRMELDLPFTQTRTPQLFAYDIYFANTGFETDNIGTRQDGFEVGGFLDDTTRWSVAVVNGQNSDQQKELSSAHGDFDANVFGRLMRRFGEARAGGYLYWGRNTLARTNPEPREGVGDVLEWDDTLWRLGLDGSIYFGPVHTYGTFLYGRNTNSFADADNPNGTEEPLSFSGGFIQVDWPLRDEVILSGRLDTVRGPPSMTRGPSVTFVSFAPALKLWLHPRVRLALEVLFRNRDRATQGAIHLELAL